MHRARCGDAATMMMLASPISSRPIRWCTARRALGPDVARLVDDPLERAYGQRLVRLVLEEANRPPLVVVAHEAGKRRHGAVAVALPSCRADISGRVTAARAMSVYGSARSTARPRAIGLK